MGSIYKLYLSIHSGDFHIWIFGVSGMKSISECFVNGFLGRRGGKGLCVCELREVGSVKRGDCKF